MSSKKILDGKIAMMMMMKKIMTKKQNKKKKKMKLEIMESIMMQNKILITSRDKSCIKLMDLYNY